MTHSVIDTWTGRTVHGPVSREQADAVCVLMNDGPGQWDRYMVMEAAP